MKLIKYLYRYLFWLINRVFVIFIIRPKFNVVKIKESDPLPKPPFVLVANHGTFFDPWIIGSFCPFPMSIMMNEFGFRASPFVRWYQKSAGAFPKKKGTSDYSALKKGLRQLKDGYSLMIFPEGQVSWDGETQPLFHGAEKIIMHLALPLVIVRISGNFLSKPWWAENYRKGKVRLYIKTFTKRDLIKMGKNDVLKKMEDILYNNDIKDELNLKTIFKGNDLAEGLTHFIWICRNCRTHDALYTENNKVGCNECGSCWKLNSHGQLKVIKGCEIGDLYDWNQWHKKILIDQIKDGIPEKILAVDKNTDYCIVDQNGKTEILSSGSLKLSSQHLIFTPNDSQFGLVKIPVSDIEDAVFQKKVFLECRTEESVYLFRFNCGSTMKWIYYIRYLQHYEIYEERKYI